MTLGAESSGSAATVVVQFVPSTDSIMNALLVVIMKFNLILSDLTMLLVASVYRVGW
jgi:hypothetical protein